MKKTILSISILLTLAIFGVYHTPLNESSLPREAISLPSSTTTKPVLTKKIAVARNTPTPSPSEHQSETSQQAASARIVTAPTSTRYDVAARATATLTVGSTTYALISPAGTPLLDAMRSLAVRDTSFTFTGNEYPSLGYFVESINGIAHDHGQYWILYVNHSSASVGVSHVLIRDGDAIEWRYEKHY
jgi:hypothetical protein